MKRFLTVFFVVLGVLFFLLIIAIAYFLIRDPYHVRPILFGMMRTSIVTTDKKPSDKTPTDKNPLLNASQEKALENIGIDPATLPSTITPRMQTCFQSKLGKTRVNEIKAGSKPTAEEIFTARECLSP